MILVIAVIVVGVACMGAAAAVVAMFVGAGFAARIAAAGADHGDIAPAMMAPSSGRKTIA